MDELELEIEELKDNLMIRNDDLINEKIDILTNTYYYVMALYRNMDFSNCRNMMVELIDFRICATNLFYEANVEQKIIQRLIKMMDYKAFNDIYENYYENIDSLLDTFDALYIARTECFTNYLKTLREVFNGNYFIENEIYITSYNDEETEKYLNEMEECVKELSLLKK